MNEAAFCGRLTMLRKDRHLTQGQMAEKLGVSRPSYTCYEIGNAFPPLGTLCKIAEFFEVSLDYLVGRTNDPEVDAADPKRAVEELMMLATFRKLSPEQREKICELMQLFVQ